jgi:hypothetical protein
MNSINP